MDDLNNLQANVTENLELVFSMISTDRPLINQVTKKITIYTKTKKKKKKKKFLHRNLNTFPLIQACRLKKS